jgi:hypothetical protein
MPANKGLWRYEGQRRSPVEKVAETDQGYTRRVGWVSRFDLAFLVQCPLFAQKQVLRCYRGRRAQTEHNEVQAIA